METSSPQWDSLYNIAESQEGYFSCDQAKTAGYSDQLLAWHTNQGRLRRVQRGIYRMVHFPTGEHEPFVVAWLWSGQKGVFSHQTALALYQLSDALPEKLHMTLPASWTHRRLTVPLGLRLFFEDLPKERCSWVGPVPVTSPLQTLQDCVRAGVDAHLLKQARQQALAWGLLSREEGRKVA